MKMLSCLFGLVFLFLNQAQAVSLRFKIDINSSGPSLYACDAGIRHRAVLTERICYSRKDYQACDPSIVCDENVPASNCDCVCTGYAYGGDTRIDMINASFVNWVDNGEQPVAVGNITRVGGNHTYFATLFGASVGSFAKVLTDLEFNLSSEQYGTEMFVDVCYRGSQIEFYRNNVSAPHFMSAGVTVTDLSDNQTDYVDLADLKVRSEVFCDLQAVGSYVYAADNSGEYDNFMNQQLGATTLGYITGGDPLYMSPTASAFVTPQVSHLTLLSGWINHGTNTPRYCRIRYYFNENAQFASNPLERIRRWKQQKVRVCTYSTVEQRPL